jgi:hypothetical protein
VLDQLANLRWLGRGAEHGRKPRDRRRSFSNPPLTPASQREWTRARLGPTRSGSCSTGGEMSRVIPQVLY